MDATAESTGDDALRAALGMTPRRPPPALAPGVVIDDAYRIERALGAGGMGVVYLARDLRLHRDVAIKLHAAAPSSERLVREAQAMARLSHPNVATVYEVGTWAEHPYVVIEYVDGGTARDHTAGDVLALYLAAARGLAAAHARGIVHRDFKPDNVLVGRDGRVCVADFGIARADAVDGDDGPVTITRTGAKMGTPAYMAPEQRRGDAVGPAADQFAFAVALWEALAGERPYAGDTDHAIADAITQRALREPPRGAMSPRVRAALERALAEDPQARWPSMEALIAALEPARPPRWRGVVLAIGAVALAGGGAALLASRAGVTGAVASDPCARVAEPMDGTWSPARHEELAAIFTELPRGADAFPRAAARIDRYATAWRAQRVEACRATHVRHEQSTALYDLRMHCLDRRRGELEALLQRFATAPAPDRAVAATVALGDLAACADVPQLTGVLPAHTPAATIAAIESEIAAARARHGAGDYGAGLLFAVDAIARADLAGADALAAEARYWAGHLQSRVGDRDGERASFEAGLQRAAAAHDDVQSANLAVSLLGHLVIERRALDEAARFVPIARAAVTRAGNDVLADASLTSTIALLRDYQDDPAGAIPLFDRAIALYESARGTEDPLLVVQLNRRANAKTTTGDLDGAAADLSRALAILESAYGPDHPENAATLTNYASTLLGAGRADDARSALDRALQLKEAVLGPDHPDLIPTLGNLVETMLAQHRPTEALPVADRLVSLVKTRLGPDHPFMPRAEEARTAVLRALRSGP